MKRVCTFRKVHFSVSKVLLEKLFFIVLKYRGFYHHSVFIVLISWLFIATQFLLFLSYLQPGDMLWNGKVTINICMRKSFSRFYCHICHTHINLLVYNGLMVTTDPISIVTYCHLLPHHRHAKNLYN